MYPNRPRGRRPGRRRPSDANPEALPPASEPAPYHDDERPAPPAPSSRLRESGTASGGRAPRREGRAPRAPRREPAAHVEEPAPPTPRTALPPEPTQEISAWDPRREGDAPRGRDASLLAGRLPTGEVCGAIIYRGSQHGDAVVVGLFDATQPGTQLEYWVELDGPGPYVLDGLKPGRYELHACLASSISESGLPREILATGVYKRGTSLSVGPGDVLDACDLELYDELPGGLLQGIDTIFYDVTDLEQSVVFYRDVLNLPLTLKERSWAEFDTGSCILALRRRPEPPPGYRSAVRRGAEPGGAQVVFRVRDLARVRDELTHRGVKFLGRVIEIPEARWTTFTDPDGNKMQLFERKSR